jgi:glycine cleavage system H protein
MENETTMAYPTEYRYTKEHEWLKIDGTTGTIGITDYAQHSLGDIVFVELPKVGAELEAHAIFGSVESVKAVSDLYCPVAGTVTEINDALVGAPETINSDANTTWIMKVELKDASAGADLLSSTDYDAFVAEETGK